MCSRETDDCGETTLRLLGVTTEHNEYRIHSGSSFPSCDILDFTRQDLNFNQAYGRLAHDCICCRPDTWSLTPATLFQAMVKAREEVLLLTDAFCVESFL